MTIYFKDIHISLFITKQAGADITGQLQVRPMLYTPCVCLCLVYLVHTLPVFVKYVWYIILLNVILYGTCIVCTVCLVCIGPGAWGGW